MVSVGVLKEMFEKIRDYDEEETAFAIQFLTLQIGIAIVERLDKILEEKNL